MRAALEREGAKFGITPAPAETEEAFGQRVLAEAQKMTKPPAGTMAFYAALVRDALPVALGRPVGITVDFEAGPGDTDFTLRLTPAWWWKARAWLTGGRRRAEDRTREALRAHIEPLLDEHEPADGRRAFMLIRWTDA